MMDKIALKILATSLILVIFLSCMTPCIAVNYSTANNTSSPSPFNAKRFHSVNATKQAYQTTTLTLSSKTIDIAGSWTGTLYQPPGGFAREYPFYLDLYQSGTEVWGTSRIEWGSYYAIMELSGSVSQETFSFTETKIIEQYLPSGIFFIKSVVLNCEGKPPKVMEGSWDCPSYNAKGTILVNKKSDFEKLKWNKNGHYYELIKKDGDWIEAKEYAEKQEFEEKDTGVAYKGYLATITSPEENSWIVENLIAPIGKSKVYPWLGGYQLYQLEGDDKPSEGWKWVTGEDWSWTNWNEGEPNDVNGYNERYLKIYPSGEWNDESIDGQSGWVNYVLIEYEPSANLPPLFKGLEEEILDNEENEIGLKVRIKYPTHLHVGERGDISVELLTEDAEKAKKPDHEHNILEGCIRIGSDESLYKEGKADLWIDPTKGVCLAGETLEPFNSYFLYKDLVSSDETGNAIIEGSVQILKTAPGSSSLMGAYDTLNWISSKLEEAADYDIGAFPSSKIFKDENKYDVWTYGWTFNYYETACVSGNRIKLGFPFSFEKEGEHPIVIYITTKFEKTDPIIVPFYEPLKIAYESDELGITVEGI